MALLPILFLVAALLSLLLVLIGCLFPISLIIVPELFLDVFDLIRMLVVQQHLVFLRHIQLDEFASNPVSDLETAIHIHWTLGPIHIHSLSVRLDLSS